MSRPANRAKAHFLKNVDLSSILEPAAPGEAAITATKGRGSLLDSALQSFSFRNTRGYSIKDHGTTMLINSSPCISPRLEFVSSMGSIDLSPSMVDDWDVCSGDYYWSSMSRCRDSLPAPGRRRKLCTLRFDSEQNPSHPCSPHI